MTGDDVAPNVSNAPTKSNKKCFMDDFYTKQYYKSKSLKSEEDFPKWFESVKSMSSSNEVAPHLFPSQATKTMSSHSSALSHSPLFIPF